jgi:hypothetical protein
MDAPFSLSVDVGAPSLLPGSEMPLPPEIWVAIFRFAAQPPYFFDARWDYGIVTAFHDARTDVHNPWEIFDASLVCVDKTPAPIVSLIGPVVYQESHITCL